MRTHWGQEWGKGESTEPEEPSSRDATVLRVQLRTEGTNERHL